MSAAEQSSPTFDLCLRDALADCISKFHQLLYIASLKEPSLTLERAVTGANSYFRFADGHPESVERMHAIVFDEWLNLSLREQWCEFKTYVDSLQPNQRQVFIRMLSSPLVRASLTPKDAAAEAKDLMAADLQTLITLQE